MTIYEDQGLKNCEVKMASFTARLCKNAVLEIIGCRKTGYVEYFRFYILFCILCVILIWILCKDNCD